MSKFLAVTASLKVALITASVAFARGDMLSVILISVLFNLAEPGVRPAGQTALRRGFHRPSALRVLLR